jgi:NADH-ubiquinone oxidoreductase chain 3
MSSMTLLIIFICIIALLFLVINIIFAPHNPYQEKYSIFECGFHSFLGQNRMQFSVKFFVYAFLYLILDLEIVLIFPIALSAYTNDIYGLTVGLIFIIIESGKGALQIDSKQYVNNLKKTDFFHTFYIENIS